MKSPEATEPQQSGQPEQEVVSPEEAEAILKEMFMTSRALRVGQTMEEYRVEGERLWAAKKKREIEAASAERAGGDINKAERAVADQTAANRIRTELGIVEQPLRVPAPVASSPEKSGTTQKQSETVSGGEKVEGKEKEITFKKQVASFLDVVVRDPSMLALMDKYRNAKFASETPEELKKRQSLNDLEVLGLMSTSMYDLIHKSGMSFEEVTNGIRVPDKEEFISTFGEKIEERLVTSAQQGSKIRQITPKELIENDQSDQAAGFVWFKGNAERPRDAREVRFYINASPDGTSKVAEYLGKLSDQLDQSGIRLQFKFRKDIGEYDRTDTCVAYVYMPKPTSDAQKKNSDVWLERIKEAMAGVPKEAIRDKNSFFTERVSAGVSFAEDTREASGKKGESYTSQITASIGESARELASSHNSFSPEAVAKIGDRTIEKLKQKNYF